MGLCVYLNAKCIIYVEKNVVKDRMENLRKYFQEKTSNLITLLYYHLLYFENVCPRYLPMYLEYDIHLTLI